MEDFDNTFNIAALAEQAGITHKQSLGVYQFYDTEMYLFVQLMQKQIIDDLMGWKNASDVIMDSDPYWQGYQHAMVDAICSVKALGKNYDV